MIVPMKKVSLVVMSKDHEVSLEKLREAGIVHLEKKTAVSGPLSALLGRNAEAGKALGLLRRYKVPPREQIPADGPGQANPSETIRRILSLADKKKIFLEQLLHQIKEKHRVESWGDFDPKAFDLLKEFGLHLVPYEIPLKAYGSLSAPGQPVIQVITLSKDKRNIKFLAIGGEISGFSPFALPALSLSDINERIAGIRNDLAAVETELESLARYRDGIEAERGRLAEQIEFETARAGMETLDGVPSESGVSWLSGYAPHDAVGLLKRAAAENGWAMVVSDPLPGDKPPTLVRNNPAVRIIQPLFSFLGTVPGYREYDISPSYLVFFCLFFAMIFGDAAYGLLLFAITLAAGLAFKKKSGAFPDAAKLFMLLSFCTVVWGSITGSWFAAPVERLPGILQALIIPPFNNSGPLAEFPPFLRNFLRLPAEVPVDSLKTRWNIQFLCFTVGACQLIWARGKNIRKLLPSLTAFAQAGWLVMMLGLYFLVLSMLLKVPLPSFAVYLIGGGLAAYFIFAEQNGGNFFRNIGKSFTNFLSIFLTAVGSFADIISYIRLFAVGLAGSIIASSFNAMAIPAEGFGGAALGMGLRIFAAALILVFGHSLNIVMNALSVVVHGVRLNLLEYAGNHLGMEWSGYAYNPFAVRQKKNEQ